MVMCVIGTTGIRGEFDGGGVDYQVSEREGIEQVRKEGLFFIQSYKFYYKEGKGHDIYNTIFLSFWR